MLQISNRHREPEQTSTYIDRPVHGTTNLLGALQCSRRQRARRAQLLDHARCQVAMGAARAARAVPHSRTRGTTGADAMLPSRCR